jgi:hypothetical protein
MPEAYGAEGSITTISIRFRNASDRPPSHSRTQAPRPTACRATILQWLRQEPQAHPAKDRRDSLTVVNIEMVLVVRMAIAPFLRCLIVRRRSSRSTSFVLRWSSAMPVGRALHVELSSAPTADWQLSEDRQGVTAGGQRVSLARLLAALCARALART